MYVYIHIDFNLFFFSLYSALVLVKKNNKIGTKHLILLFVLKLTKSGCLASQQIHQDIPSTLMIWTCYKIEFWIDRVDS